MSVFPIEPECGDGVMDLVFVIDGSKSLGPTNFELVKQFVNGIVDSLDISNKGTHVGLLQFSTKVRTEFTLGHYTSAQNIRQAVARMQYMGRGSMTGSALRHMFESSFSAKEGARPNIPRVSIVFTDGRSQDDVSEWATKAKNSGTIYLTLTNFMILPCPPDCSLTAYCRFFSVLFSFFTFRDRDICLGCRQSHRTGTERNSLRACGEPLLLC